MCGIVGYAGQKNAQAVLLHGLENLEYRGYDSAGLALCHKNSVMIEKAVGKLVALKRQLNDANITIDSTRGIAHTRWATHGAPSFLNAHPHRFGRVTLVHNGIVENFRAIKQRLVELGHHFASDTDTEVAAHLLDSLLDEHENVIDALQRLGDIVHGAYAFVILIDDDERVYFAKNGSPLVVGRGHGENFLASDQAALVEYCTEHYALNDLEYGFIATDAVAVFDQKSHVQEISWEPLTAQKESAQKNGHKHFMHKEIFEQPETVAKVIRGRLSSAGLDLAGFGLDFNKLENINSIHLIACGSAYYAGLVAKPLMEATLRMPVHVEIASEYRYRDHVLTDENTLVIAISQSGETIDTLAALERASKLGARVMSVCNTLGSAIPRRCEGSVGSLFLHAGPEISVASTKAFVAQIAAMRLFAMAFAKKHGLINVDDERGLFEEFIALQKNIKSVLAQDSAIRSIASTLIAEQRMFYLGRGDLFPIALEGALKMKELSYIFAEGYPAGELKHGPIAIIDQGMPVIVLFSGTNLDVKTTSNLQEVKARGARIISIMPHDVEGVREESTHVIEIERLQLLMPILVTIPLQLLAYHLADLLGLDVDKPKNLAKSVTVE